MPLTDRMLLRVLARCMVIIGPIESGRLLRRGHRSLRRGGLFGGLFGGERAGLGVRLVVGDLLLQRPADALLGWRAGDLGALFKACALVLCFILLWLGRGQSSWNFEPSSPRINAGPT